MATSPFLRIPALPPSVENGESMVNQTTLLLEQKMVGSYDLDFTATPLEMTTFDVLSNQFYTAKNLGQDSELRLNFHTTEAITGGFVHSNNKFTITNTSPNFTISIVTGETTSGTFAPHADSLLVVQPLETVTVHQRRHVLTAIASNYAGEHSFMYGVIPVTKEIYRTRITSESSLLLSDPLTMSFKVEPTAPLVYDIKVNGVTKSTVTYTSASAIAAVPAADKAILLVKDDVVTVEETSSTSVVQENMSLTLKVGYYYAF